MKKYFHGGRQGMKKGQYILPPAITGVPSSAVYGNHLCDKNQVYVTTEYAAAAMYAAVLHKGEVYEVQPVGEMVEDPDCDQPWLSYSCRKARILKRHRLTKAERAVVLAVLEQETDQ